MALVSLWFLTYVERWRIEDHPNLADLWIGCFLENAVFECDWWVWHCMESRGLVVVLMGELGRGSVVWGWDWDWWLAVLRDWGFVGKIDARWYLMALFGRGMSGWSDWAEINVHTDGRRVLFLRWKTLWQEMVIDNTNNLARTGNPVRGKAFKCWLSRNHDCNGYVMTLFLKVTSALFDSFDTWLHVFSRHCPQEFIKWLTSTT